MVATVKAEELGVKTLQYPLCEYDEAILESVKRLGGFENAHTHFDRASTLQRKYLEHKGIDPVQGSSTLTLKDKQNLTGELHKGAAYTREDLYARMEREVIKQILMDTRSVTSFVDATPDLEEKGLIAINVAEELREKYKEQIAFQIAVSPIFGFKDEKAGRWEVYREAAQKAQVLGGLPEKDDAPDRIGYDEHIKRLLQLGIELHKEVHLQVDQANDPREKGTETIIQAVRWLGSPKIDNNDNSPTVWSIHAISPSGYDDKRFYEMVENLIKYNIGVICCPNAALSMRQLRPIVTPTHNSIARVLEMAEAGVRVKIGTDNICDVYIPSGDGSILTEVRTLSNAVRFYVPDIMAKLGAGKPLNETDKKTIRGTLHTDKESFVALEKELQ